MKYFLPGILIVGVLSSMAQNSYRQKVYAFIQKQETGESRHFIYIEMPKDSLPIWDSAVIEKKKYVVHFSEVETMPMRVGLRKSDKKAVVIKPAPDTKMWMAEFDATNEPATANNAPGSAPVMFKGKFKGRKLSYKILTEVELE